MLLEESPGFVICTHAEPVDLISKIRGLVSNTGTNFHKANIANGLCAQLNNLLAIAWRPNSHHEQFQGLISPDHAEFSLRLSFRAAMVIHEGTATSANGTALHCSTQRREGYTVGDCKGGARFVRPPANGIRGEMRLALSPYGIQCSRTCCPGSPRGNVKAVPTSST